MLTTRLAIPDTLADMHTTRWGVVRVQGARYHLVARVVNPDRGTVVLEDCHDVIGSLCRAL